MQGVTCHLLHEIDCLRLVQDRSRRQRAVAELDSADAHRGGALSALIDDHAILAAVLGHPAQLHMARQRG